jgi:hypothetical protein
MKIKLKKEDLLKLLKFRTVHKPTKAFKDKSKYTRKKKHKKESEE